MKHTFEFSRWGTCIIIYNEIIVISSSLYDLLVRLESNTIEVSTIKSEDTVCITFDIIAYPWNNYDEAAIYTYNDKSISICVDKLNQLFSEIPTKLYFKSL